MRINVLRRNRLIEVGVVVLPAVILAMSLQPSVTEATMDELVAATGGECTRYVYDDTFCSSSNNFCDTGADQYYEYNDYEILEEVSTGGDYNGDPDIAKEEKVCYKVHFCAVSSDCPTFGASCGNPFDVKKLTAAVYCFF